MLPVGRCTSGSAMRWDSAEAPDGGAGKGWHACEPLARNPDCSPERLIGQPFRRRRTRTEESLFGFRLQRQYAVRTNTDEFEDIGAALAVDEYEIGPDVTVAAALSGSGQRVVAVPGIWRLIGSERLHARAEGGIDGMPVPSFEFSAVVAFELTGQPDRSSRRHGRRVGWRTIPRRSRRCRGRRGWRRR